MSDGSTWYQVRVSSNGNSVDLWLKGENDIMVTKQHTYGELKYEAAHPHKEYQECECGQKAYTATVRTISSCQQCLDEQQSTTETPVNRIPAEAITVTNGYRYLYIYKPTGEKIKQVGGDEYEVHMTPNSTYQLNTVVSPSNTTDPVQYSVQFINNNPSNGAGVSVSSTGLVTANETAHGTIRIRITCGNCSTDVFILMCNAAGERL